MNCVTHRVIGTSPVRGWRCYKAACLSLSSDHAPLPAAEGGSHAHQGQEGGVAVGDGGVAALGSKEMAGHYLIH